MWNLMLYCEIVDYSWPFLRKIEEWLNFGNFPKMGLETSKHRSNIILECWIRIWQRLLIIHIIWAQNGWFIQKRLKSWKSDISLMVYSRLVLPLVLTRIGKYIYVVYIMYDSILLEMSYIGVSWKMDEWFRMADLKNGLSNK